MNMKYLILQQQQQTNKSITTKQQQQTNKNKHTHTHKNPPKSDYLNHFKTKIHYKMLVFTAVTTKLNFKSRVEARQNLHFTWR